MSKHNLCDNIYENSNKPNKNNSTSKFNLKNKQDVLDYIVDVLDTNFDMTNTKIQTSMVLVLGETTITIK